MGQPRSNGIDALSVGRAVAVVVDRKIAAEYICEGGDRVALTVNALTGAIVHPAESDREDIGCGVSKTCRRQRQVDSERQEESAKKALTE